MGVVNSQNSASQVRRNAHGSQSNVQRPLVGQAYSGLQSAPPNNDSSSYIEESKTVKQHHQHHNTVTGKPPMHSAAEVGSSNSKLVADEQRTDGVSDNMPNIQSALNDDADGATSDDDDESPDAKLNRNHTEMFYEANEGDQDDIDDDDDDDLIDDDIIDEETQLEL